MPITLTFTAETANELKNLLRIFLEDVDVAAAPKQKAAETAKPATKKAAKAKEPADDIEETSGQGEPGDMTAEDCREKLMEFVKLSKAHQELALNTLRSDKFCGEGANLKNLQEKPELWDSYFQTIEAEGALL